MAKTLLFYFILLTFLNVSIAQTVWHVNTTSSGLGNGSSWANQSNDLQSVINNATAGDTIWVAQGTYFPTKDDSSNITPIDSRRKTFLITRSINIYGGFNGSETLLSQRNYQTQITTLSGDIGISNNATDNCYHVVSINITADTVDFNINGFTIKNGNSNDSVAFKYIGLDSNFWLIKGGAVFFSGTSALHLDSCKINNNNALKNGGAIFANKNSASLSMSNDSFQLNNAHGNGGAIFCDSFSNVSIKSSIFKQNFAAKDGGAICFDAVISPTISNTKFYNNFGILDGGAIADRSSTVGAYSFCDFYFNRANKDGGGLILKNGASSIVSNCIFDSDTASALGGGARIDVGIYFSNCVCKNNIANYGGGIYYGGATDFHLDTCKINNNKALYEGGGLFVRKYAGEIYAIKDSFLFNNGAILGGAIRCDSFSKMNITTSAFVNNNAGYNGGGIYFEDDTVTVINNSKFTLNSANGSGGAVYNKQSSSRYTNCVFQSNSASSNGGAICNEIVNTGMVMAANSYSNCNFLKNLANSGGAFSTKSSTDTFLNCIFKKNIGSLYAGAMFVDASATEVLKNDSFVYNKANNSGAIYNHNSSFLKISITCFYKDSSNTFGGCITNDGANDTISNSKFIQNFAQNGGAIYSTNAMSNAIEKTIFSKNKAGYNGGAMNSYFSFSYIRNSTFSDDSALINGGAIADTLSFSLISKDTFQNNFSNSNGGGLFLNNALGSFASSYPYNIYNNVYQGNKAANNGGAMYITKGSYIHPMHNEKYFSNITANNGGGIFADTGVAFSITTSTFNYNAAGNGGGIYLIGDTSPVVSYSNFNYNSADGSGGGFVDWGCYYGNYNHCNFYINTAGGVGGGMVVANYTLNETIAFCKFESDTSHGIGGGLAVGNNAGTTVTHCLFNNNAAADGGGVFDYAANYAAGNSYSYCIFNTNKASGTGGGMVVSQSEGSNTNCVYYNNSAAYGGGLYRIENQGNADVVHCTFYLNNASISGGGIYDDTTFANSQYFNSFNSVIWGNTSTFGKANYDGNSTIKYSDVEGGYNGVGNINANPSFTNASNPKGVDNIWATSDDGLMIANNSPCANKGDNANSAGDDIVGNARPFGSVVDMGAYELMSVVLPLNLISFTANCNQQKVELNWQTAAERNTKNFEVQHSTDLKQWEIVNKINAAGNSYEFLNYSSTVNVETNQLNYFRLKQNDLDGSYTYSDVVYADCNSIETTHPAINLYPNPTSQELTVNSYSMVLSAIEVTDLLGKTWLSILNPTNKAINIQNLPAGIYFLKTTDNEGLQQVAKFVKE